MTHREPPHRPAVAGAARVALGTSVRCGAPLLVAGWALGLLTAARTDHLVWFSYVPAPVALLACLLWWWAARRGTRLALRLCMVVLTAGAAFKFLASDMAVRRRAEAPPRSAMRLVHWNIHYAQAGYPALFDVLLRDEPDILLLSEARFDLQARTIALRRLNLFHSFYQDGLSILSKYPMEALPHPALTNARAYAVSIATPSGPLQVALVDVYSHPLLNRQLPLSALADWTATREARGPLIVAGDFNTLRDSADFRPLRRRLRHAYERAGFGWPYSWPAPVPLYALDHVWVSDAVAVHAYALRDSRASDHLRQVLDFSLPGQP